MGTSSAGNFAPQITDALTQANQPKSELAKQFSGTLQGSYLPAIAGLLNAGALGNAFPGMGGSTPGMMFNQNPLGYHPTQGYTGPNGGGGSNPSSTGGNGGGGNGSSEIGGGGGQNLNIMPGGGYSFQQPGSPNQTAQSILSGSTAYANDPLSGLYARFGNGPIATTVQGNTVDNRLQTYQQAIQNGYQPTPAEAQAYQAALAQSTASQQYAKTHGGFGDPAYSQSLAGINNNFPGFLDYQGNVVNGQNSGGGLPNQNYLGNPFADPGAGISGVYNPQSTDHTSSQDYLNQMFGGSNTGGSTNGMQAGGMPDFSSLIHQANPNLNTNYNPSQSLLSQLAMSMGGGMNAAAPQSVVAPNAQLQTGLPNAQDSQYYNGVQQTLQNQFDQGRNDIRARFGASGGASRGTPAAYAEAQYDSQNLPTLASALGGVRQQEVGNQLQAQNQGNSAMLQARGQDIGNSQQNVQNFLQSLGLNNNYSLGQQSNAVNLANNAGNLQLGQNNLLSQLSQFNAGQNNSLQQQYMSMLQGANQQQIQNQFTGYQNIAQIVAALAGSGIPGGGANVNLGAASQSNASALGTFGQALNQLKSFF